MKSNEQTFKRGQVSRTNDDEDSASLADGNSENKSDTSFRGRGRPNRGKQRGGGSGRGPSTRTEGTSPSSSNTPSQTFKEGDAVLLSYGLSVSGRKERILSPVKTDKIFHLIEQCWNEFILVKPELGQRFSFAEFKHASALMLYQRLEQVKFDGIGVKPMAQTRIPLPRNLRVYQPIWGILSEIGLVEDDDLRVTYIPDGILPKTQDLTDPEDVEGLVTCTLYDWVSSWEDVRAARQRRPDYDERLGYQVVTNTNEVPDDRTELIAEIVELRRMRTQAYLHETDPQYTVINGVLQRIKYRRDGDGNYMLDGNNQYVQEGPEVYNKDEGHRTTASINVELNQLHDRARRVKKRATTIKFDLEKSPQIYAITDNVIETNPGAYGGWLHWDPRLWIEYEQFVEILSGICMFSLSMPVETKGTYAWILPVETREEFENDVFCKLPKASIPPVTWIKALLMQTSTLPDDQRSTWYCETDTLSNVLGLRRRYIKAGMKRAAPVDQYGTF
jgi:hypothetical protein